MDSFLRRIQIVGDVGGRGNVTAEVTRKEAALRLLFGIKVRRFFLGSGIPHPLLLRDGLEIPGPHLDDPFYRARLFIRALTSYESMSIPSEMSFMVSDSDSTGVSY